MAISKYFKINRARPESSPETELNDSKGKGIWRYIPHERIIDEDAIRARLNLPTAEEALAQERSNEELDTPSLPIAYEIRDEANRKWWKFFDEYEYRVTKKTASEHKWYHWFDKNDTPAEKKLIIKLDVILCFFAFVMYWVKYLDQTNINNAYVSGMREDIGMRGNDLVNTQSIYTVGAIVFQLPFMYMIHRYPSNWLLPLMDIGWGLFTLALYTTQNVGQLQAYRFFVGVFESAFYPTINYLLGSWYTPTEYARRGGMFYWGQMLGVLTAGLLQAAAYDNLHFVNGLEGWRWMFIIDAIITLPIGIIGFWALPGIPSKCHSLFFSDEEIFLARERLRRIKVNVEDDSDSFFTKALWKDMLSQWKIYLFVFLNVLGWNNSNASSGSYILWLRSLERFSVVKVNQLSAITPALGVLWIWLTCSGSDLLRSRFGAIAFSQTFNFLGNLILAIWEVPEPAKWFAFMLQYFGWAMIAVGYGWMGDSMRSTPQQRAITTICMNMFGQSSTAFTAILVWRTVEAPRFLKGYTFSACCAFSIIIVSFVILALYKREERQRAAENGIIIYDSAKGEPAPELLPDGTVVLSDSEGKHEYIMANHEHTDIELTSKTTFVVAQREISDSESESDKVVNVEPKRKI
ncbi:Biotin symporter [Komagataella phaffii CBS 7435]|uniref:Major facilitator superfamily n=2 Tax=Komagataella phaffii TaxID=460519 RepID=C4R9E6_KOMPG|nr:GQ67_01374T0 [Komagataella phaffii]AOA66175.1 GQ68_01390T0 [Komagataella phaffii GS115]CAH2447449.1 Biotin symporter [Komagataella phaffii CBS 7435]CAY67041.1 Major facilitator superfamily [Komagataella pastoris]CCA37678.1 Biotin symporter [Komagataella phaffii CBS 7435]